MRCSVKMRRRLSLLIVICVGLCVMAAQPEQRYGLRFNRTDSLPYTLFVSRSGYAEAQIGDYVCFRKEGRPLRLVKQVMGIPGDQIELREKTLWVANRNCGDIVSTERVHPIGENVVPEGHVFVCASHPESFDSRYAEFGLLELDQIEEQVWPIY